MGHWPKNNTKKVQTFAGGAIWVDVCEKLLIGRLTALENYDEMLSTNLGSESGKLFRPKIQISEIWILGQIVTQLYLAPLSKNMLKVFHDDIANLARGRK